TIRYFKRVLVSSDTWGRSMQTQDLTAVGHAGRAKVAHNFDERLVIAEYLRILGKVNGGRPRYPTHV
ncbi:hypothetical protein, partial [Pandoraea apista]|uniref:hypothetical protein n=1 Tax=Pandoraea apista TaxID=93218 RepID=UPI0035E3C681